MQATKNTGTSHLPKRDELPNAELDQFFSGLERLLILSKKEAVSKMRLARLISHNRSATQLPTGERDCAPEIPAAATPGPAAVCAETAVSTAGNDAVAELAQEIASQGLDDNAVINVMAERSCAAVNAAGAAIALEMGGHIVCCASTGMAPALGAVLQPASGLSGECIRTGEVVNCEDALLDTRVDAAVRETLTFRSAVIAPVTVDGKIAGLLELFSPQKAAFDHVQAVMALRIAELISAVVAEGGRKPVAGETNDSWDFVTDSALDEAQRQVLAMAVNLLRAERSDAEAAQAADEQAELMEVAEPA